MLQCEKLHDLQPPNLSKTMNFRRYPIYISITQERGKKLNTGKPTLDPYATDSNYKHVTQSFPVFQVSFSFSNPSWLLQGLPALQFGFCCIPADPHRRKKKERRKERAISGKTSLYHKYRKNTLQDGCLLE